jgi:hypothetical protein
LCGGWNDYSDKSHLFEVVFRRKWARQNEFKEIPIDFGRKIFREKGLR